jgi:hypothetical protein
VRNIVSIRLRAMSIGEPAAEGDADPGEALGDG